MHISQIACLSCCSVLRERASGGSDVGRRLLSTPSRLFRHTGQVSCCDGKKKKKHVNVQAEKLAASRQHFFSVFFLHTSQQSIRDTLKTFWTNVPRRVLIIKFIKHIHSSRLPAPTTARCIHCESNGDRAAS